MRIAYRYGLIILLALLTGRYTANAQDAATVGARIDAAQITVGDQARLFIEAKLDPKKGKLQWATIPDTFNKLEIVEKSKIDTVQQGNEVIYKQRLLITGFDSGLFMVPPFVFSVLPNGGNAYTIQTDSFSIGVQTVPVDTSKGFIGIKGIREVKTNWMDYIWYIVAAIVLILATVGVMIYLKNRKKPEAPPPPPPPSETPQAKALRLLSELEQRKLWENNQPKEYHTELVDILRNYIEERFGVDVMESTSDEILYKAAVHKDMSQHRLLLSNIFYIADLAKFAKAQPTPQEHHAAMEYAKQFVNATRPVAVPPPSENPNTPPQS